MTEPIIFINTDELSSKNLNIEKLSETILYSDKETLLKIIEALMESNDSLRKYIAILEKNQ